MHCIPFANQKQPKTLYKRVWLFLLPAHNAYYVKLRNETERSGVEWRDQGDRKGGRGGERSEASGSVLVKAKLLVKLTSERWQAP